jgi:hypothetical protein
VNAAQRIFDDLLSLEVSVILKPGMTARKMPAPAHALLDIIGDYDSFVCGAANAVNPHWDPQQTPIQVRPSNEPAPGTTKPHVTSAHRNTDADGKLRQPLRVESVGDVVSEDTFDELRERAVEAEAVWRYAVQHEWVAEEDRGPILRRIYRNCDQIKGIVSREPVRTVLSTETVSRDRSEAADLPLTSDELITLRKVWEIGVETVVMQTVVQLDGDIVTRIQTGRETAANKAIHDLHRQSVESALSHWHFLGKTVSEFLGSTLKGFFLR